MTGIKEYTDRHGKRRRYYRRKGAPSVAISMDLKGAALAAEIARLDALYKPMAPRAGTLRLLVAEYKAKAEHWKGLRDRTQKDYERVFDKLEPVMDHALTRFSAPIVVAIRDKARDTHGFKFANQTVVTLKTVFSFGLQYGHMKSNPAGDVPPAARPTELPDANRPWLPAEAVALTTLLPIHIGAPTAIAAYLGVRQGDILKMPRTALAERLLAFTTSKTRRALELPVCDDLRAILTAYQVWRASLFADGKRSDSATTLFVNSRGRPWTEDGFKTSFMKARDDLLVKKAIGVGITFHGARHGVATILAEAGYEEGKVKHLLGHGSETITEHYSRRAKRRQMLKEMADAIQAAMRNKGENVIELGQKRNESV
ncbi:MAG: tyrosine-type recombinase/integrase [Devosia nanyangense]|nr:tyrosine-type recombinase/integrase [Devosia nanyangense]